VFEFVRCSSKLLGKARMIRSVIRRQHVRAAEILFVGDETRDIEACQKVGVRIVAVTWGYNSRRSIVAMKPDFIFDDSKELVALLANQPAQPMAGSNPSMTGAELPAHQTTALP
jgi:phosphoglycolate phosphatase-like HAD superfamily hydrolase